MPRTTGPRRGNYSMLMGSLAFVVVGFGALAVDISLITMSQLQAQATADAASHAALIRFRKNLDTGEGDAAAAFIVNQNKVGMGVADLDNVIYGQWDYGVKSFSPGLVGGSANAVKVELSRQGANGVNLWLAPAVFGINKKDVVGESISATRRRAIMLVQDMSCSMMTNNAADPNSAIEIARQANMGFLDYMLDHPSDGDIVGLAMFSQRGAIPPTDPAINPHPTPWATVVNTDPPWLPLTAMNNALVPVRIGGICNTTQDRTSNTCAIGGKLRPHRDLAADNDRAELGQCTNPEIALNQAINQLITVGADYFKAILLMTDGMSNCDTAGVINVANAQSRAASAGNLAAANGISVFPITITSNGSFDATANNALARGQGFAQEANNAAALIPMYEAVAEFIDIQIKY